MDFNLGLHKTYTHIFIVANGNIAILGINFLQKIGLVVDPNVQGLSNTETQLKACGVVRSGTPFSSSLADANEDDMFLKCLKE